MRARTSMLLTIVIAQAKPQYGDMLLYIPPIGSPPPAPQGTRLTWGGTISGDINGEMYFYKFLDEHERGQSDEYAAASHFEEIWVITDSGGDMLLMGTDHGVVSWANAKYRMSGVVTDAASLYEDLIGHRVYMSGDIIENEDETYEAPGVFRVN